MKSAFPKEAIAKILIRPQPNQDLQAIIWNLKKHFHTHGFPEVEVKIKSYYPALRTSPKTFLAKSLVSAVKRVGLEPVIWPCIWAGAPYSVIVHVPYGAGSAMTGGHYHQANEYVAVDTIPDGMKLMAIWCYEFAELLPPI